MDYRYYPAAEHGTHPCGPRRLEVTDANGRRVVYACRTDHSGPVPVCAGINPEWPEVWAAYQQQQAT